MRIAIVEDESAEFKRLNKYLNEYAAEEQKTYYIERFPDSESFLKEANNYDLVFMDIQLPGINGMEACRELRKKNDDIFIVFVTNLAQYAVDGYEVNAVDFLLKPLNYDLFVCKMKRMESLIYRRGDKKLILHLNGGVNIVEAKTILYIEIIRHQLTFHFVSGEAITVYGKISDMVDDLKPLSFSRCHKSYIVNLRYVTKVVGSQIELGQQTVPIGATFKSQFKKDWSQFLCE